jgi:hypothetical protein
MVTAKLSMVAAANYAKSMTRKLVGSEIQSLTVDEIELDDRKQEWVVGVSFWIQPPKAPGVTLITPQPFQRQSRVLRIGAFTPPNLISMKVKPLAGG